MAKKNKPTKHQAKPAQQPKKDIKSKDSAYHPEECVYNQEHPVAKSDREEANEFEKDIKLTPEQLGEKYEATPEQAASGNFVVDRKEITDEEYKGSALEEVMPDLVKDYERAEDQAVIDKLKGRSISIPRWEEAQKAERAAHDNDPRNTSQHYAEVYKTYFKYVGLGTDLQGLHVIEVGPADHPALAICSNLGSCIIVEPLPSHSLLETARMMGVGVLDEPLETINLVDWKNTVKLVADKPVEIWLFNVMQHVIDPNVFIEKCKDVADRIRFFEPYNTPIEPHHPHSYAYQDYINYFGGCCQIYKGGSEPNFHTADCMYGVWVK
jgi:hypothetical protein